MTDTRDFIDGDWPPQCGGTNPHCYKSGTGRVCGGPSCHGVIGVLTLALYARDIRPFPLARALFGAWVRSAGVTFGNVWQVERHHDGVMFRCYALPRHVTVDGDIARHDVFVANMAPPPVWYTP